MKVGDRVHDLSEGGDGVIVEKSLSRKPAMKGLVKVVWDDGGWTWAHPWDLVVVVEEKAVPS